MTLLHKKQINKCYDISPYADRVYLIEQDGLKIPIVSGASNILVWMSGGADSALLTYLLCQHIQQQQLDVAVHVLQFVRKWNKAPWQETVGRNVFDYFVERFQGIRFVFHNILVPVAIEGALLINRDTLNPTHRDTAEVVAMDEIAGYITVKQQVSINYNATTMNPPIQLDYRVADRDVVCNGSIRDSERLLGEYHPTVSLFANPFIFTDKSWIIKQYKDLGLLDLLNRTRSCESYVDGIDFRNWDGNVNVLSDCNTECFWCLERNWALEQNDLLRYKDLNGKICVP